MTHARAQLGRLLLPLVVAVLALAQPMPASAADWVQNFMETELWSGPDAGAISFGSVQRWDYFEVMRAPVQGRFYVRVARNQNFAYVDATAVGPSGPPPPGWPLLAAPPPPIEPAVQQPATAPVAAPPAVVPPEAAPSTTAPDTTVQASLAPIPNFTIIADRGLWPALQQLERIQHTWTLQALAVTGTRLEWGVLQLDASGVYQPRRSVITLNVRWMRSDPRALAATIEHEAKHVADMLAGLDVTSPEGCIETEVNALWEEAKTWGELVGPNGKANPQDELERSLNVKLAQYRQNPAGIRDLILRNPGYRSQCRL